jgi:peptide/nickel transport system substrate-binding protein
VQRSRSLSLLALLLAFFLVAAACGGDDDDDGGAPPDDTGDGASGELVDVEEGGTIVYAAEQEPTGFNSNTSKDNLLELRHIMRHVWPYYYRATPDVAVETFDMADGPAEVVSEDPFTVEWKIKEEAVWDDGKPISSDDLEWYYLSCNGKIDPGEPTTPPSPETDNKETTGLDCASTSGYDQITKFTKVDGKTARAEFSEPYVEYEILFSEPIPPSHIGKARPGGWNTGFNKDPGVSGGPFNFKEWADGDHITITKDEDYWGTKPHLDTIIYRQIPDPSTHPDALENDEVQIINPQPQVDLKENVEALPGVEVQLTVGPTWEHLDFNFQNELLKDFAVRQAIAYGIDRQRYVDTLMKPFTEDATVLNNRVYVTSQDEYEEHGAEYAERDVEKATQALEDAGYEKGTDDIYAKGGKKLSFRIRVASPNPLREQLEELIKADLEEVGIEVKIDNFSDPETIGSVGTAGDFDLFIFAWVGTPFPISGTQQIFGCGSGSNFGKYCNEEADAKVAEAAKTLDTTERAAILNEVDEMLWEDLPNIPLFQKPTGLLAYKDTYGNIVDNQTSEGFFWNSEQWGIKAAD